MKNKKILIVLLCSTLLFISHLNLMAQEVDPLFNYQAVARTSEGDLMINQTIGVLIQIIDESEVTKFEESHQVTTSELGIFTLAVGNGSIINGTTDNLDFLDHTYSLHISIDPSGGENFATVGSSPIIGVPLAEFAKRAATAEDDNDRDSSNELQNLSIEGNIIALSNGGSVTLPSVEEADGDPNNEIQTLSKEGNTITLSNGGGSVMDNFQDDDADPTNEIQALSMSDGVLSLSQNGGSVTLPMGGGNDEDPENELQVLEKSGNVIALSNGGGSVIDEVDDDDADPENELQSIEKVNNEIRLSQGGGIVIDEVEDDDADPENEIQTLSLNNSTLSLSDGGGSVELPSGGSSIWTETSPGVIEYGNDVKFDFSGNRSRARFYNSSGTTNVRITEGSADTEVGFVLTYGHNKLTALMGGSTTDYGILRTYGPNGNINTSSTTMSGLDNCGMVAAHNEQGGVFASLEGCFDIDGLSQTGESEATTFGAVTADIMISKTDDPRRSDKTIRYTSLQGPEAAAYVRGTIDLENGVAEVRFSEDFKLVANASDMTIMLTPHSAESKGLAAIKRTAEGFIIKELFSGNGTYKVDWEVKAVRKGFERFQVVANKR